MASDSKNFVRRWTRNTFYGWLMGFMFILVFAMGFDSIGISGQFFLGLGMGIGVGWMQWRIGKSIGIGKNWIWMSIIGMTLPFLVLDLLPVPDLPDSFGMAISIGSGALLTGFLQSLELKKFIANSWRWIPVCFLGWITVPFFLLLSEQMKGLFPNNLVVALFTLLLILGGGVSLGLVTGIGTKKILILKLKED